MADTDWQTFLRDAPVVEVQRKKNKRTKESADASGKKKKKKSYSPGVMHPLGVGERRVGRGIAKAASDYLKRSKKSASSSRDGAVKDALNNLAKSQGKALKQIAKIPREMTKSPEYRRASKRLRRTARRVSW